MINRFIGSKTHHGDGSGALRLIFIITILAILSLPCSGCSNATSIPNTPNWVASQIYFGRNIPNGGEVSEQQFSEFLEIQVTPAFPAGLTVNDAYG